MYRKLFLMLTGIAVYSISYAQQFVAKTGSEGYYRITSAMEFPDYKTKETTTWYFKVTGVTDSSLLLSCTLLSAGNSFNEQQFNSADPLKCAPFSSRSLELLSLLNQPFNYTLKRQPGAAQPGILQIYEQNAAAWQIKPATLTMMKGNINGILLSEFNLLFPSLPGAIDKLPGSWLSADSTFRYQVTGKTAQTLNYTTRREKTVPGFKKDYLEQQQLNVSTGMLVTGGLKNTMTKDGAAKPEMLQEVSITSLTPAEAKSAPLSDDFKAAVIKTSSFSEALTSGVTPEYDSAKVAAYFKQYDPLFGKSAFYQLSRLDVISRSNAPNRYEIYNRMLLQTPDSLIAGSRMHLFNKSQGVISTTVDSAYETIKYLSRHKEGFRSWVQESFSQSFRPETPLDELENAWKHQGVSAERIASLMVEVKRARSIKQALLDKMVKGGDTLIVNEVYPMYLWAQASAHAGNKDSVVKIAAQLEKISDNQQYSNRNRYALLLYKQLQQQGNTKEAARLLDRQLAVMTKTVADSTNTSESHYADQNMLAYAYKLKSEAVEKNDPKAAMEYLSKAALYSPKSNKEKAYTSFYDRAFLDSKENYRAEFAEALIKQGNGQDGMKILAQQLQTDPAIFTELQSSFTKGFPDLDFYDFFHNVVVKSWKAAPSFSLQSPDKQTTYKLEDYRGKWLLIDFWGTWCAPCRREMPDINKFVAKIKDRKDISFLSIACHDNADAVMKYLAANKYQLPSSMSDNKVEKDYVVPGYPAKFLISPTGTVLHIAFGQDWEKAVDEFTALQPKKKEDAKIIKQKD